MFHLVVFRLCARIRFVATIWVVQQRLPLDGNAVGIATVGRRGDGIRHRCSGAISAV